MGDGHLGKCKTCTKHDSAERIAFKSSTDVEWVLKERERGRLKSARARRNGQTLVTIEGKRLQELKYRARYPEKYAAHKLTGNAIRDGRLIRKPCELCNKKAQAHHDDYSKPLKVRWFCPKHHMEHHRMVREKETRAKFKQCESRTS